MKRTHNEGIREDCTLIIKKTGNPVFFPSFYKPDKTKDFWWQINRDGIVYKKATLKKINGKFIMNGKHITKHLNNDYQYSVDSNVYVKISNLEQFLGLDIFIKKVIEMGNKEEFYTMVNKYKPAAITIGWLRGFMDDSIEKLN